MLGKMKNNKSNMTYFMNFDKEIWTAVVCWFVKAEGKNILIDTGAPPEVIEKYWPFAYEEINTFDDALESIMVTPDTVDMVIQTHLLIIAARRQNAEMPRLLCNQPNSPLRLSPIPFFMGPIPAPYSKIFDTERLMEMWR